MRFRGIKKTSEYFRWTFRAIKAISSLHGMSPQRFVRRPEEIKLRENQKRFRLFCVEVSPIPSKRCPSTSKEVISIQSNTVSEYFERSEKCIEDTV